jgi:predicted AlkP superfamily pyrophosphatase or phosphodiesterase
MRAQRPHPWLRSCPTILATVLGLSLAGSTLSAPALAIPAGPMATVTEPPHGSAVDASPRAVTSSHVVVISIDGLRPDAIEKFGARTLQELMRQGSYTLAAQTIMPSRTLPSHTSMLTGEEPEQHGITWNSNETDDHGVVAVPTIFAKAHEAGFRTAAFFSKGKFNHLEVPNSLDHTEAPEGNDKWSASRTVASVERYLATERPNLLFVHIGEPDYAGHKFSWMSTFYGSAVRKADRAVDRVLAAADKAYGAGNYTVIVTADHGGHGWSHGSEDRRDVTIPWITWGKGVQGGTVLGDGVRTMDTAVTALWLLGLDGLGVGRPVQTAFVPQPLPNLAHVAN